MGHGCGALGSYSLYLRAIQKTDELTGRLWDEVQSNANYRGKTTMPVVPELGRDGDMDAANGFLNHRSGDPSCRNVWALAVGGGIAKAKPAVPSATSIYAPPRPVCWRFQ